MSEIALSSGASYHSLAWRQGNSAIKVLGGSVEDDFGAYSSSVGDPMTTTRAGQAHVVARRDRRKTVVKNSENGALIRT